MTAGPRGTVGPHDARTDPALVRRIDSAALAGLRVDALLLLMPRRPLPLAGVAGLVDFAGGGRLSRAYQAGQLHFVAGERALLPAPAGWHVHRLLCVGLGEPRSLDAARATQLLAGAIDAAHAAGATTLAAGLPALGLAAAPRSEQALQAIMLRALTPAGRAAHLAWLRC